LENNKNKSNLEQDGKEMDRRWRIVEKIIRNSGDTVMWSLGAQANEVYIEQVGSSSTINITQQGTDNRIGDATTPAYIGSGSNTVTIDQIGSTNVLDMVVNGAGTDVIVTTTGDNNVQTINCGTTLSDGCSGSYIKQQVTGDSNTVTQNLGSGANHTSEIK
jgi:hypothetical protein